jgi:hypothetical protein
LKLLLKAELVNVTDLQVPDEAEDLYFQVNNILNSSLSQILIYILFRLSVLVAKKFMPIGYL